MTRPESKSKNLELDRQKTLDGELKRRLLWLAQTGEASNYRTLVVSDELWNGLGLSPAGSDAEIGVSGTLGNLGVRYTFAVLRHPMIHEVLGDNPASLESHCLFSHHPKETYEREFLGKEASILASKAERLVRVGYESVREVNRIIGAIAVGNQYLYNIDFDQVVARLSAGESVGDISESENNPAQLHWIGNMDLPGIARVPIDQLEQLATRMLRPFVLPRGVALADRRTSLDSAATTQFGIKPGSLLITNSDSGWRVMASGVTQNGDVFLSPRGADSGITDPVEFANRFQDFFPVQEFLVAFRLLGNFTSEELGELVTKLKRVHTYKPVWKGYLTRSEDLGVESPVWSESGVTNRSRIRVLSSYGLIRTIDLPTAQ
jgi:hypothetical protein